MYILLNLYLSLHIYQWYSLGDLLWYTPITPSQAYLVIGSRNFKTLSLLYFISVPTESLLGDSVIIQD
jgi:hypothetical protein